MSEQAPEFSNMSGTGVHDKTLSLAKTYLNGASILVVGSGEGSLEHKLILQGVRDQNIKSLDYDPSKFRIKSIQCQRCDLNESIPFQDSSFDIVFATEVIEHLYNPHRLIEESWRVLKPGGMLFLTTPNVHSIMQKIRYLFTDNLAWFYERDYRGSGHIHPIFDWLLERMTRNKFELIKYTSQKFHLRLIPNFPSIPIPFESRLFAINNIYAFRKITV